MDAQTTRAQAETASVLNVVTQLTGLQAQWSGNVVLVHTEEFKGKKTFSCDVQLERTLAEHPLRWSTIIHEALHCCSAGYLREDYQQFRGWEEGVVEQLQRLFRPEIIKQLELDVSNAAFEQIDEQHRYNKYIQALEMLRREFTNTGSDTQPIDFYLALLRTPIRTRASYLLSQERQQHGGLRPKFISMFSLANATLNRRNL